MGYSIRLFTVAGMLGGLFCTDAATLDADLQVGDVVPAFKCVDRQ